MFCGKCGAENEDGARFCKGCGAELTPASVQKSVMKPKSADEATGNVNTSAAPAVDFGKITEKFKDVPKGKLIGICAAVMAAVVLIAVIATSGPTINLNNYLTIEAEGYDGYGNARVSIDWDAIEEKYGDKIKYKDKAKEEYGNLLSLMTPTEALADCVSVSLDQKDKLSNGSEITYKWKVDEDVSEYLKCKVKYKDDSFTVEGLTEVGKFNPFDSLTVTFEGIAPNGQIDVTYDGSELNYYDFSCDKTSGLRNGDKVTISIDDRDMSYYAERLGKVPDTTEKEYEVSGLDEYVDQYSDLTEEFISTVKKEAEDSVLAYTASSYRNGSTLTDLTYAGYILNAIKDGNSYSSNYNNLYIIYKGTASNSDGDFSTCTVYFPVRFSNVLSGADGLSYRNNEGIVGYSNFDNYWYSTKGYINPLVAYMDIVEEYSDSYTAECGDGFEVYAEYESINKLDDIAESYKETLYADAKATIESYVDKHYNEGVVENLSVAGEYLLIAKTQGSDFSKNNKYYVVYSATVSSPKGRFDTSTVYYPVEYDGVVKLPGDEYMVTASNGIVGDSRFGNTWYYTDGYIDGSEMYSDIITSNRNNYTYEVSEGLKSLGE